MMKEKIYVEVMSDLALVQGLLDRGTEQAIEEAQFLITKTKKTLEEYYCKGK